VRDTSTIGVGRGFDTVSTAAGYSNLPG